MQTREITKLGITASRLGFGSMRLPEKDRKIDDEHALAMIDYLYQNGVTYYDTAWFYHNGQSEPFLRRALVERYPRSRFTVATKLHMSLCQAPEDMTRIFETQRRNLGVETIDFYMLHGIGAADWAKAKQLGAPDYLTRLKDEGKIRFFGFSFHDQNGAFVPILDDFPWDFCQIQLNYADWYQRRADHLYNALVKRGIPIIVMEPVRGGGLANLPPEIAALLTDRTPNASAASWALRFCGRLPHVDVILSGMSTLAQCRDNVDTFSPLRPLADTEQETLHAVARAFDRLPLIPCTTCRYCANCPQDIDIPGLLASFNQYRQYQADWDLKFAYWQESKTRADACTRCGLCESVCPQHIAIMEELERVHEAAKHLLK